MKGDEQEEEEEERRALKTNPPDGLPIYYILLSLGIGCLVRSLQSFPIINPFRRLFAPQDRSYQRVSRE